MMETETRIPTIDRLPSREQVEAIECLDDLSDIQERVMEAAKQIEVDLEFRSDDLATDEWEHRARRALAAHYTCNGHLTRRIKFLRGKKPAQQAKDPLAKARKAEAHAQLVAAQTEAKKAKAATEREKTVRQLATYAARQSLLMQFHAVAVEMLDRDTISNLMRVARERLDGTLLSDLNDA